MSSLSDLRKRLETLLAGGEQPDDARERINAAVAEFEGMKRGGNAPIVFTAPVIDPAEAFESRPVAALEQDNAPVDEPETSVAAVVLPFPAPPPPQEGEAAHAADAVLLVRDQRMPTKQGNLFEEPQPKRGGKLPEQKQPRWGRYRRRRAAKAEAARPVLNRPAKAFTSAG